MASNVEKIVEGLTLGEGPHWDAETNSLYFVDLFDHFIHKYDPASRRHTKAYIDGDGTSDKVKILERLYEVDLTEATYLTMENVIIWKTMGRLAFDFNLNLSANGKPIYTLNEQRGFGPSQHVLDGMTIDTEEIFRWQYSTNLNKADYISNFWGPNLDELYVTSGRLPMLGEIPSSPDDGATYRVSGLKAKGLPGVRICLSSEFSEEDLKIFFIYFTLFSGHYTIISTFYSSKMAPKVERIKEIETVELGEGPHWDEATQSLYFVDLFGKAIHKYVPATKKHTKAVIGTNHVTLIIPVKGEKNKFLISIGRELAVVTWDGESEKVSNTQKLYEVDNKPETIDNRFNDGKCDSSGRLWAGTMGAEPVNGQIKREKGSLFSFQNNKCTTHLTKVGISNGLAWSNELNKFYYIDTHNEYVEEYDFDIKNGTICKSFGILYRVKHTNGKPIFTPCKHNINGFLDGMAIDTDGNLWIAIFNGYRIIQIDPRTPETLLQSIPIPAKQWMESFCHHPNMEELIELQEQMQKVVLVSV
ncbi:hypothetical protein NQ317_006469 [Molorchus minor]|uniref:SMP-30/Gluconolactonase/LRE-like region domain-containing protein n=1 Tax=Molorchus minor TaxID=1323400 RepID=A0ABQ9J6W0_9CUCU|nr:hypothetical protein NQ317_006469 [Molorchus minor]